MACCTADQSLTSWWYPTPDDVVPVQRQKGIVPDVGLALDSDVVTAVGLYDQPLADEEIDTVAKNPELRGQPHPEPPETLDEERLEA